MALPVSIGDVLAVTNLAWKTFQGARKACGDYDDLTREIQSLYSVLRRLDRELDNPESLLNPADGDSKKEMRTVVAECHSSLHILDVILVKYNALGEKERSGRKWWQKVPFGTGRVEDVQEQRAKLNVFTSTLSFHVNITTLGSQGRVEKQMKAAGGDLEDIRKGVNRITAELMSKKGHDGSVMTNYDGDETAFWKELRRRLIKGGFTSSRIRDYMDHIQAYVTELADRGVLDEQVDGNIDEDLYDVPLAHANHQRSQRSLSPREWIAKINGDREFAYYELRGQQVPVRKYDHVDREPVEVNDDSDPQIRTVEHPLTLSLEALYHGTSAMIVLNRKNYLAAHLGYYHFEGISLKIDVEPGLKSGTKIEFRNVGDQLEHAPSWQQQDRQDIRFIFVEVRMSRTTLVRFSDTSCLTLALGASSVLLARRS